MVRVSDAVSEVSGMTEKPEAIANLLFLLPALSFGVLWYFEKTEILYVLTVISLLVGVFLTVWAMVERMKAKLKPASFAMDLKLLNKAVGNLQNPNAGIAFLKRYAVIAILIWLGLLVWALNETWNRLYQAPFALLFLLQTGMIAYSISVFILMPSITQIGLQAAKILQKKK